MSRKFYSGGDDAATCSALNAITAQYKITGVVWYVDRPDPGCTGMRLVFHDKNYALYSLPVNP
jgi:hypothetical protein